jgi:hypothetical protein
MSIIAKKEKSDFIPAPEGLWPGICCDVVDKGLQPTQWGEKHKVQIRWLVTALPKRDDGKPHMISKTFTLSLHEKANLRLMLEVWRGKKFTEDELGGFDLEKLVGLPCSIQVAQEKGNDGAMYAFPQVVLRATPNGTKVFIPPDYVRAQNRPDYKAPKGAQSAVPVDDDDPFGGALPMTEDETTPF